MATATKEQKAVEASGLTLRVLEKDDYGFRLGFSDPAVDVVIRVDSPDIEKARVAVKYVVDSLNAWATAARGSQNLHTAFRSVRNLAKAYADDVEANPELFSRQMVVSMLRNVQALAERSVPLLPEEPQ